MKKDLNERLDLFVANARAIRSEFPLRETLARKLAALAYSLEGREVDCAAVKECHSTIKSGAGIFSSFRGNLSVCVAAMLSLKENPREIFSRTSEVYESLKGEGFWPSDHLAIAAHEIASGAEPKDFARVIKRTRAFYEGMKARGFFRTGKDDYIFSAMLGLSDIDVQTGTERIDVLYKKFKPSFRFGNGVQALTQVLVLSGDCEGAAGRVLELRDAMKMRGIRFDRYYTLPSLAVLSLLPSGVGEIVKEVSEAQAYLKTQKGFGPWSVSKQALLLFSVAAVASVRASGAEGGAIKPSVSAGVASIIIAQQAAMFAMFSASVAASNAAAAGAR